MKRNTFKFAVLSLALATLTACGGGSSGNQSSPVADTAAVNITNPSSPVADTTAMGVTKAFATNVIPKLNSDPGLSIIDIDKNGVRDDIDILIRAKYTIATDVSAAIQYAKAAQMEVAASSPAPSNVPIIFTALISAVDCAVAQMGAANAATMIADLRSATVNTKERFLAYSKTEAAMSGQSAVITDVDPKTFCR